MRVQLSSVLGSGNSERQERRQKTDLLVALCRLDLTFVQFDRSVVGQLIRVQIVAGGPVIRFPPCRRQTNQLVPGICTVSC